MKKPKPNGLVKSAILSGLLVVGMWGAGSSWAAPPEGNPGQPFVEILKAIRGVTQNWDKKLDSTNGDPNGCNSDRFTCIWPTAEHPDGAAVRDNETGIVWERSPDTTTRTWTEAIFHCRRLEVSGRKGWALPMVEPLASLVDTSNADPTLPLGHPFSGIPSIPFATYWSSTTASEQANAAWWVNFFDGNVFPDGPKSESTSFRAWCVRGGQSYDGQDLNGLH